jgi:SAM-dependent methyltransferase
MSCRDDGRPPKRPTISQAAGEDGKVEDVRVASCPACDADRSRPSYLGRWRYQNFEFEYLACGDCGSLFVDPMPDDTLLESQYGPEYLDTHYALELGGGATRREFSLELDEAVRLVAEQRPGARVLDVGCGAGQFLVRAHANGLQPEGHEPVPSVARAVAVLTDMSISHGELHARSGSFEAVHLADVLEHSPRPLDLLLQTRRLLRSGGLVIARGPLENQANVFQLAVRLSRLVRTRSRSFSTTEQPPYHVILFTLRGWRRLMQRAGLCMSYERVYEVHWPAPEQFSLSPVSIIKEVSLKVSRSGLLKRWRLGNRVISVLTASDPAEVGHRHDTRDEGIIRQGSPAPVAHSFPQVKNNGQFVRRGDACC